MKVYRRANQRMFLAIGEAIAVQQIGLLPLGQPFQTIVQFSARFLLFHDTLRLHGVGVGYPLISAKAQRNFMQQQRVTTVLSLAAGSEVNTDGDQTSQSASLTAPLVGEPLAVRESWTRQGFGA